MNFGNWIHNRRKRKCVPGSPCCSFSGYTGFIGAIMGCNCSCHVNKEDIIVDVDTPIKEEDEQPLNRKRKEPAQEDDESDTDSEDEPVLLPPEHYFATPKERIAIQALLNKTPLSDMETVCEDTYVKGLKDDLGSEAYMMYHQLMDHRFKLPVMCDKQAEWHHIPLPLSPQVVRPRLAILYALEIMGKIKAKRIIKEFLSYNQSRVQNRKQQNKKSFWIGCLMWIIPAVIGLALGGALFTLYYLVDWVWYREYYLKKAYKRLKGKKQDCKYGKKCKKLEDKNHTKRYAHPEKAVFDSDQSDSDDSDYEKHEEAKRGGGAKTWDEQPYGRKSRRKTTKGKTKGKAQDRPKKKASFDPAEYEDSDFSLGSREYHYWRKLKDTLREKPDRENVYDTVQWAKERLERLEKSYQHAKAGPTARRMYKRDKILLQTLSNAKFKKGQVIYDDSEDKGWKTVASRKGTYKDSQRKWAADSDDDIDFDAMHRDFTEEVSKEGKLSKKQEKATKDAWDEVMDEAEDLDPKAILKKCKDSFVAALPDAHPFKKRQIQKQPRPLVFEANVSGLKTANKCWVCNAKHNYWVCPQNKDKRWRMALGAKTQLTDQSKAKEIPEIGVLYDSHQAFWDKAKRRVVKQESFHSNNPPVPVERGLLQTTALYLPARNPADRTFVGTAWVCGNYGVTAAHCITNDDLETEDGEKIKPVKLDKETAEFLMEKDIYLFQPPKEIQRSKIDICEDNQEIVVAGYIDGQYCIGSGKLKHFADNEAQHSAPTDDGMSGCPIFNKNMTRVIGIHQGSNGRPADNYGKWFDEKLVQVLRTGRLNA